MIGLVGDRRSRVYEPLDGISEILVPANFEQLIHDLLKRFRTDILPKHIGDLARRSVR
jgi:hypothetical protein